MKIRFLLLTSLLIVPSVLLSADNDLLVEERFEYPYEPFGLLYENGGKGFGGSWISIERNWTTVDGAIRREGTNLDQYRKLASSLPDRFYVRADFKEENEPDGIYLNSLALLDNMEDRNGLYFGLESGAYRLVLGDYRIVSGKYSSGQWVTLVVEFQRTGRERAKVNLWVNPDSESDDPLVSSPDIALGTVEFQVLSPQTFDQEGGELWQDNLLIGKTFDSVLTDDF